MAVGNSFVFAVLPPVGRGYGLTELQISLIISPAAVVFVLGSGIWGRVSDRVGRKPLIVTAVIATGLATVALGAVLAAREAGALAIGVTFLLLMLIRVAFTAFGSAMMPCSQAYVADRTSHARRTASLAVVGAGFPFGLVCGPALVAATSGFGTEVAFYVSGGLSLATLPFVLILLSEPRHHRPQRTAGSARTPVGQIAALLGVLAMVFTIYGVILQVTGFRIADRFGFDGPAAARNTGIALMVAAATLVAAQLVVARLRLSPAANGRTILVGLIGVLVPVVGMAFATAYWQLVLAMAIMGAGFGAAIPATIALLTLMAERAQDQGRVGGLSAAALGSGFIFGPPAASLAYNAAPWGAYAVGAALTVATIGLAVFAAPRAYAFMRTA